MKLLSKTYSPKEDIPVIHALEKVPGGRNISPELQWGNVHENIKSFVLAMVDHHPVATNWVHWLVINIPPSVTIIREGASNTSMMPLNCTELTNTYGNKGYGGPNPPAKTGKHNYDTTLYALDIESINLEGQVSEANLLKEIRSHVLDKVTLTGYFERPSP